MASWQEAPCKNEFTCLRGAQRCKISTNPLRKMRLSQRFQPALRRDEIGEPEPASVAAGVLCSRLRRILQRFCQTASEVTITDAKALTYARDEN